MNKDLIVSTLPIKPQAKASIGRITGPLLAEFISTKLGCDFVFSINTLHSYEDRTVDITTYLNSVKDLGIKYDSLYVDSENTDKYLNIIYKLIENGTIIKKKDTVLRCECGRVDILKKGIRHYDGASLYSINGDEYICNHCHSKCKEYKEEGLYFNFDEKIDDSIQIFPTYLKKNVLQFSENLKGNQLLISKMRNTGYEVDNFNIDIDFLWMNYVANFEQNNQVLIASNREVFKMYVLNYINRHAENKNITFVAHPYITKPEGVNLKELMNRYDDLYRKLSILYTIKWRNKECQYNPNLIEQIAKLGGVKRDYLYRDITSYNYEEGKNLEEYFDEVFLRGFNIQRDTQKIKKLGIR